MRATSRGRRGRSGVWERFGGARSPNPIPIPNQILIPNPIPDSDSDSDLLCRKLWVAPDLSEERAGRLLGEGEAAPRELRANFQRARARVPPATGDGGHVYFGRARPARQGSA